MITHYFLVLLWVRNDFGLFKSFWLCTNHFGRAQFVLDKSKLLKNCSENYLDSSKRSKFGSKPILLDRSNLFWACPNYKKNSPENYLVIWTVQIWICTNFLDGSNLFWSSPNYKEIEQKIIWTR